MTFSAIIKIIEQQVWGLPSLIFIFGVAVYVTLQLQFVQLRYLKQAISLIFTPNSQKDTSKESITPLSAFINTLGGNIGNGSLAGIGVALYAGGPGSIIWLLVLATFSAALRYAEVFLSAYFVSQVENSSTYGPIAYIRILPGGKFWSYLVTFFTLCFVFTAGGLAQSHAVGMAVKESLGISQLATGLVVLVFMGYIFLGGSQRIVAVLDKMVPFKVFLFLITALCILVYHYQAIPHALYLMLYSSFNPQAFLGGSFAFALQNTMAVGFQQGVFASEAGLGTAAVVFGATKGKDPVRSGILAMLGVFINVHVICFLVALSLIVSGVWNNGLTSSALVVAAYETVFGKFGGWLVLVLVINFAMSVSVAAAFNGKRCWDYLFGRKFNYLFSIVFSICSFCGAWMHVDIVWSLNNIINALLMILNLFGLLYSVKLMKKELNNYSNKHE